MRSLKWKSFGWGACRLLRCYRKLLRAWSRHPTRSGLFSHNFSAWGLGKKKKSERRENSGRHHSLVFSCCHVPHRANLYGLYYPLISFFDSSLHWIQLIRNTQGESGRRTRFHYYPPLPLFQVPVGCVHPPGPQFLPVPLSMLPLL